MNGINENLNERKDYIDVAKGIGILLVVTGHLVCPDNLHNYIYSFHMPLFFILSGMLISYRNKIASKDTIKRLFYQLMVPYFTFSLAYLFFYEYMILHENFIGIVYMVFQTLCFRGMAPLWFLPSLFFGEIFVMFLNKYDKRYQIITLTIIAFAQLLIFNRISLENIYGIIREPLIFFLRTSFAVVFIMLGKLLLPLVLDFVNSNILSIVTGFVICFAAYMIVNLVDLQVNMHLYKFSDSGYFLICGLLSSVGIILLARGLTVVCLLGCRILISWGGCSLMIMALHYPIRIWINPVISMVSRDIQLIVLMLFAIGLTVICDFIGRGIKQGQAQLEKAVRNWIIKGENDE